MLRRRNSSGVHWRGRLWFILVGALAPVVSSCDDVLDQPDGAWLDQHIPYLFAAGTTLEGDCLLGPDALEALRPAGTNPDDWTERAITNPTHARVYTMAPTAAYVEEETPYSFSSVAPLRVLTFERPSLDPALNDADGVAFPIAGMPTTLAGSLQLTGPYGGEPHDASERLAEIEAAVGAECLEAQQLDVVMAEVPLFGGDMVLHKDGEDYCHWANPESTRTSDGDCTPASVYDEIAEQRGFVRLEIQ